MNPLFGISDTIWLAIIAALTTLIGAVLNKRIKDVHTLVNSRATKQDEAITLLTSTNVSLTAINAELRDTLSTLRVAINTPAMQVRSEKPIV